MEAFPILRPTYVPVLFYTFGAVQIQRLIANALVLPKHHICAPRPDVSTWVVSRYEKFIDRISAVRAILDLTDFEERLLHTLQN